MVRQLQVYWCKCLIHQMTNAWVSISLLISYTLCLTLVIDFPFLTCLSLLWPWRDVGAQAQKSVCWVFWCLHLCPDWEWGLLSGFLCHLEDYVVSGLKLSDRNTDFRARLTSAMSVLWKSWPETAHRGRGKGRATVWGKSWRSWWVAVLGNCLMRHRGCTSLVMGFGDGNCHVGIYASMQSVSCSLNSDAGWNTMALEQHDSHVPAKSMLYLLWLWCLSPMLLQAYVKRNAQS